MHAFVESSSNIVFVDSIHAVWEDAHSGMSTVFWNIINECLPVYKHVYIKTAHWSVWKKQSDCLYYFPFMFITDSFQEAVLNSLRKQFLNVSAPFKQTV